MQALFVYLSVQIGGQIAQRRAGRGQGLVEYALIIMFIAIVCVAAISALGISLQQPYEQITAPFE